MQFTLDKSTFYIPIYVSRNIFLNQFMCILGGSRSTLGFGIRVIRAPKLVKILPMEKMLPFKIDSEFAQFATTAIPDLAKLSKRVDIRILKKMQRLQSLENRPLQEKLADGQQSIGE